MQLHMFPGLAAALRSGTILATLDELGVLSRCRPTRAERDGGLYEPVLLSHRVGPQADAVNRAGPDPHLRVRAVFGRGNDGRVSSGPMAQAQIKSGVCHAMFAYDIGLGIDLEEAGRRTADTTEPERIRHSRRAPEWLEFKPAPLRVIQSGEPISIAGFTTARRVESVLYDFGAVSVAYSIPLSGPLTGLLALSDAMYENRALLEDSRRRVEQIVQRIGSSVDKPYIAPLVEDYAIFQLPELVGEDGMPLDAARVMAEHRRTLARVLRAEPGELSEQEVSDAISSRIAYGPGEEAIIDWNAAVVLVREADDVRSVLEYANVELLELRRLDDQLDLVLDRSYKALRPGRWPRSFRLTAGRELRRIAELQMDSALLFEGVNNALKLVGDQYLARVYRLAAERMHLPDWDTSILRKLQTAESIYEKLSDQETTRRMEALEWVIILLFAFEIAMTFVRH